jgi:FKBP-type peptidyl-prolyl cis-trans isomerase FklB
MKNLFIIALVAIGFASCNTSKKTCCDHNDGACKTTQTVAPIASFRDTVSYMIGTDIAKSFKANNLDISLDLIIAGMRDGMAGTDTMFTQEQFQEVMGRFQKEMQLKQQQTASVEAAGNKEKGRLFLEANKTKEGVKTTASGLQYKVLREGTGANPGPTSKVTVNYEGRLIDGTIFDSSYERNEPISFGLDQVIKGWTEGLQLMNVGSMYELYIPSELGYGDRSIPSIPAGSTLIFKVELLSFQ